MDELTDPDAALVRPAPRAAGGVSRDAARLTGLNLASRLTGFGRVVATAGALGIAEVGDAYQRANLVSNILFELLAGGLLFSVLVPTFVGMLDSERRPQARALAGALLARALAVLSVVVVAGIALGPLIMRVLTVGVDDGSRPAQIALGSFLLWFVMPQLLLYAVGAVSTALLQADRRFVAAATAPIFNNAVVIVTMLTFAAVDGGAGIEDVSLTGKLVLGAGTLLGTVAMTIVPVVAASRAHLSSRPRWRDPHVSELGSLARKGAWGAGDIGLNQVMVAATIVFAGGVAGGVIAYQTAFTFFLLPHAVLAHPIFTTLFPLLASHAAGGDRAAFGRDVGAGVRALLLLLGPAAALLAATAMPILTVVQVGQVDDRGVDLVASVLAAYSLGLVGYSSFFLLTRASYALDDVRGPTLVYLWVTVAAVAGMFATARLVDGDARVVGLGLVHSAAVTAGAAGLFLRLRRRVGAPVPTGGALIRAAAATLLGGAVGWSVVEILGWDGRFRALVAAGLAWALGAAVAVAVLAVARTPEIEPVLARLRERGRGRVR